MTFSARSLSVSFIIVSENYTDTLTLDGHRVEALLKNVGGGMDYGQMTMRIFGMSQSDMNVISTDGMRGVAIRNDVVILKTGDGKQAFRGNIISAYIDYSAMPDISMVISAIAGGVYIAKPAAVNSYKGTIPVAQVIQGLAQQMSMAFVNNGVTTQITNPVLDGTLMNQLNEIVSHAGINCTVSNETITIWPNGSTVDTTVTDLSPQTGMLGYPTPTQTGWAVKSLYDPEFAIGRKCKVTSSVNKANGTWFVQSVTHELSTLVPDAPWFSHANLTYEGLYVSNN